MKKINKDKVKNSTLWKPTGNFDHNQVTNSWFDASQINEDDKLKRFNLVISNTIRTKPVALYPNHKQRNILLQWNDIYRQVYNLTVKYFRSNPIQSFISTRKIIDNLIKQNQPLMGLITKYKIPKQTRDNAIHDCIKAYKTAFSNLKSKNITHFRLRYKKKTHHLSSIVIELDAFSKKSNSICPRILGEMKSSSIFSELNITKACRLCYNSRSNKFVLRVPEDKIIKEIVNHREEDNTIRIISLDPGMRTFQTGYTPSKNCYKFVSEKSNLKFKNLIRRIEKVNTTNPNHTKFLKRMRGKLQNTIKDMHNKLSLYLCRNFKLILVGNMSTKSIISKSNNLSKTTKKECLALSHYLFKQRLISKAEEYGVQVKIVDESYTSKTCGGCGELNESLGSSKVFNCPCTFNCDRDVNGARNILLKNV